MYEAKSKIRGFIFVIDGEFIGATKLINHVKSLYVKLELAVYFYEKMNFIINRESLNEETAKLEYFMIYHK